MLAGTLLLNILLQTASPQSPSLPLIIAPDDAKTHLLDSKRKPVMPPIARVAHWFAWCSFEIVVGTDGRVMNSTILECPVMLQGAGLDYVNTLRYTPFTENGQPRAAMTIIEVDLTEGNAPFNHGERAPDPIQMALLHCDQARQSKVLNE